MVDRVCVVRDDSVVRMRQRSTNDRKRRKERRASRGAGAYFMHEFAELALVVAILAIVGLFTYVPLWVLIGLPLAKASTSAGFYALFLRRAFRRPARPGAEDLIGKIVKASTPLRPEGQVKVDGEIWSARSVSGSTIAQHEYVEIVDVRGNTVLVARQIIER